jgi:DNA-directed RNA polymerase subunit RPC12/RpoP
MQGDPEKLQTKCGTCGVPVSLRRLPAHMRKVHSSQKANQQPSGQWVSADIALSSENKKHTAGIRLNTQRSTGGSGLEHHCSECGEQKTFLKHYEKSSRGPVWLCNQCLMKVLPRSFGTPTEDRSVSVRTVPGGAVDSNRRRH